MNKSLKPVDAVGAEPGLSGVAYRVWAPEHRSVGVSVVTEAGARRVELAAEADGYFSGIDAEGRAGDRYFFDLGGAQRPDPASRFQPQGVEGLSQVVDPGAYVWKTPDWRRPAFRGRVIYELHVGAFTREGTFAAAAGRLDALVDLGVNTVELMPLADFAGRWNWGYDGVMLFAPSRSYGTPDDLRALVDAAHARGLAVILDVVYNHLGPSGNVLPVYGARYFHDDPECATAWGRALNYAEPAVRAFFLQNARHWLDEYRFDGLRLDATHAIDDGGPRHLVADIAEEAHRRGAWVIAEDERNEVEVITPSRQGGWGVDAVWADDFHHTVRVALTGQRESHFQDYTGSVHEWMKTLAQGWFYDGRYCPHWNRPRGTPAGHMAPERFVVCISNHDQAGNRPLGDRLHEAVSPAEYRAVSMLLCLSPYTPMLFMGQEWAATARFPFFSDLPGEIGAGMREGRLKEFEHYGASYPDEMIAAMPDPQDEATFAAAKLDWAQRGEAAHAGVLALYAACLRLRASEPIFQNPSRDRWEVRTVQPHLLALRWHAADCDWMLIAGLAGQEGIFVPWNTFTRPREGRTWVLELASNGTLFDGVSACSIWRADERGFNVKTPGAVLLQEVAFF